MIKRVIFALFSFCFMFLNASEKYTILVCETSTLESALVCKKNIYEKTIGEVFIAKEGEKYFTYLNIYDKKELAEVTIQNATAYVKKQNPYIKQLDEDTAKLLDRKKLFVDLEKQIAQNEKKEIEKNSEKTVVKQNENQKSLIPLSSLIPDDLELVPLYPY